MQTDCSRTAARGLQTRAARELSRDIGAAVGLPGGGGVLFCFLNMSIVFIYALYSCSYYTQM